MITKKILIQGIVQGVGFRPFIKRLADSLGLNGKVSNTSSGVEIYLNVENEEELEEFIKRVREKAPSICFIVDIISENVSYNEFDSFSIEVSEEHSGITLVSPDMAICSDCRKEVLDIAERRFYYPFTNCTNCGPRYSIIKKLPYDRENTVMKEFEMCEDCEEEYTDVDDRRFHAQPIACFDCGPHVWLNFDGEIYEDGEEAFVKLGEYIDNGGIAAVKGLGGYHLICSAEQDEAVLKLRQLKKRSTKPFAVMAENVETVKRYAVISDEVEDILQSSESPIVIFDWYLRPFSKYVSPHSSKVGVMTAYTPLHVILFQFMRTKFIVATSGNYKDEPIAKTVDEAESSLKSFTSVFLHHNRDIYTRVDDSVLSLTESGWTLLRRGRGYAPYPVMIQSKKKEEVFAGGANLKSSIAFYKDGFAFLSQYIGDLDNIKTEEMYQETYENMKNLFGINAETGICDIHSQYRSTLFVRENFSKVYEVQHHVAHFASNMAENMFYGDALGIIMDGFGLGTDNKGWGGEIFIKQSDKISRLYHIENYIQPGLDSSAKNPARMMISYLYSEKMLDSVKDYLINAGYTTEKEISLIEGSIKNRINIIETSSAGRLFEAAGSLVLNKRSNEYEGETAVLFENIICLECNERYNFYIENNKIKLDKVLHSLINDVVHGVDKGVISARFHNGFVFILNEISIQIREKYNINTVILSGGVMQNITLLNKLMKVLEKNGFRVLTHKKVPSNDGGIALGQLYCYLNGINFDEKSI